MDAPEGPKVRRNETMVVFVVAAFPSNMAFSRDFFTYESAEEWIRGRHLNGDDRTYQIHKLYKAKK